MKSMWNLEIEKKKTEIEGETKRFLLFVSAIEIEKNSFNETDKKLARFQRFRIDFGQKIFHRQIEIDFNVEIEKKSKKVEIEKIEIETKPSK